MLRVMLLLITSAPITSILAQDSISGSMEMVAAFTDGSYLESHMLMDGRIAFLKWHAGYILDPATGSKKTIQPNKLCYSDAYSVTALQDGKLLLAGGEETGNICEKNQSSILDVSTGTWVIGPALLDGRSRHTATLLNDGSVLFVGGVSNNLESSRVLSSAELFDGSRFISLTSLRTARVQHTATLLNDGRVLVVGGEDSSQKPIRSVEIWNPDLHEWKEAPPLKIARHNHSAHLLEDGRVMVVGGTNETGMPLRTVEIWNPANEQWEVGTPLPVEVGKHSAVQLASGNLLLVPGNQECQHRKAPLMLWNRENEAWDMSGWLTAGLAPGGIGLRAHAANDGSAYVVTKNKIIRWSAGPAPYPQRYPIYPNRYAMETRLPDGRLMLLGDMRIPRDRCGDRSSKIASPSGVVEFYDPKTQTFSPGAPLSVPRAGAQVLTLKDGKVLVAGGHATTEEQSVVVDALPSELWDPLTGQWQLLHEEMRARKGEDVHINQLDNGNILLFFSPAIDSLFSVNRNGSFRAVIWDSSKGDVQVKTASIKPREYPDIAVLRDGRVLYTGASFDNSRMESVIWDSETGEITPLEAPRADPGLWLSFVQHNGSVLQIQLSENAMYQGLTGKERSRARRWEPSSGKWTEIEDFPTVHLKDSRIIEADDGSVYVESQSGEGYWLPSSGNAWKKADVPMHADHFSNSLRLGRPGSVDRFFYLDTAQKTWVNLISNYVPRYRPAVTLLANGKVMIAGGDGGPAVASGDTTRTLVQLWDPVADNWEFAKPLPRQYSTIDAVTLPSGRVLVTGIALAEKNILLCHVWDMHDDAWTSCGEKKIEEGYILGQLDDGRAFLLKTKGNSAVYDEGENEWIQTQVRADGNENAASKQIDSNVVRNEWLKAQTNTDEGRVTSMQLLDPRDGTWKVISVNVAFGKPHLALGKAVLSNGMVLHKNFTLFEPISRRSEKIDNSRGLTPPKNFISLPDGCVLGLFPLYVFSSDGRQFVRGPELEVDIRDGTFAVLSDGTVIYAGHPGTLVDIPNAGIARVKASCSTIEVISGSAVGVNGGSLKKQFKFTSTEPAQVKIAPPVYKSPLFSTESLNEAMKYVNLIFILALIPLTLRYGFVKATLGLGVLMLLVHSGLRAVGYFRLQETVTACQHDLMWAQQNGEVSNASYRMAACLEKHADATARLILKRGKDYLPVNFKESAEQAEKKRLCPYVGVWLSQRPKYSYRVTLNPDGKFFAKSSGADGTLITGKWSVQGLEIVWDYDNRPDWPRDVNIIVPKNERHFTLIEMNGSETEYSLIERRPSDSSYCKL